MKDYRPQIVRAHWHTQSLLVRISFKFGTPSMYLVYTTYLHTMYLVPPTGHRLSAA